METSLEVSAGFGVHIRLCIDFLFVTKCWDLWSYDKQIVIYSVTIEPLGLTAIAGPDGSVNWEGAFNGLTSKRQVAAVPLLRIMGDLNGNRIVDYYGDQLQTDTLIPNSRTTNSDEAVSFNDFPASNHVVELRNVSQHVDLSGSNTNTIIRIPMASYDSSTEFEIGSHGLDSDSTVGASFTQCNNLEMTEPLVNAHLRLSGTPCRTNLSVDDSNNVSLAGDPSKFIAPITITGIPTAVHSDVPVTSFGFFRFKISNLHPLLSNP